MVEPSHLQMSSKIFWRVILRRVRVLHLNPTCTRRIGGLSDDELPTITAQSSSSLVTEQTVWITAVGTVYLGIRTQ